MSDSGFGQAGEEDFQDRNAFFDLLLGLISLSERTLSVAVELADPVAPARIRTPPPAPPPGPILR
jgi:hypothetical protein